MLPGPRLPWSSEPLGQSFSGVSFFEMVGRILVLIRKGQKKTRFFFEKQGHSARQFITTKPPRSPQKVVKSKGILDDGGRLSYPTSARETLEIYIYIYCCCQATCTVEPFRVAVLGQGISGWVVKVRRVRWRMWRICAYIIYIYSVYECIYVCIHIHIHIWYDIICITRATDTESLLWKSIIGKTNFNGGQHQFISWNEAGYLWYSKNTEWFLMQYFYVSLNSCIVIESDLQSQDECSPKELTCRFYFSFTRNLWRVYLSSIIFHRKKKVIKKIFLALQQLQHVTLVCLKILLMEEILHQLSIQR